MLLPTLTANAPPITARRPHRSTYSMTSCPDSLLRNLFSADMRFSESTPFRLRKLVGRSPEWAPHNQLRQSHFFSRNNQKHLDPGGLAIFRSRAKLPLPERAEQETLLRVIGRSN